MSADRAAALSEAQIEQDLATCVHDPCLELARSAPLRQRVRDYLHALRTARAECVSLKKDCAFAYDELLIAKSLLSRHYDYCPVDDCSICKEIVVFLEENK